MPMIMITVLQLYKAEEVAHRRSSHNVGIEELLFIMRRDKVCNVGGELLNEFNSFFGRVTDYCTPAA